MSNQAQTPAVLATKKSRALVLALTLVLLVLLGGSGAVFWVLTHRGVGAPGAEATAEPAPTSIVHFEPFVVNLADAGGSRFLRLTLALVVAGEEVATRLEEDAVTRMRIRSTILELLAQETSTRLMSPEGKARLKQTIAERVAHTAHGVKVNDVLFSEFVVQL